MSKKKNTQVGDKINRPGQLAPHPLQSSIGKKNSKENSSINLNYDYKRLLLHYSDEIKQVI